MKRFVEIGSLIKSVLERFLGETGDRKSVIVYSKVCAIVMLFLKHLISEEILPEPPVQIQRPRRVRTEIRTFGNPRVPAFFMLLATPESAQRTLLALASDFRWHRREPIIRPQIAKSRTARIAPITACMQALQQDRPLRTDDESDTDAFFLVYHTTPVFAWRHSAIGEKTDLLS